MKLRALWYAAGGLVWACIPLAAEAALVTCGGASTPGVSTVTTLGDGSLSCDICYLGEMIQRIINFLLGLSVPIAAALFAWAGILYFSSRGNLEQIGKAHRIFSSVLIGFFIALAAWFLVQTLLNVLVANPSFTQGGWGWNTLNCKDAQTLRKAQTERTLQQYLSSSLATTTVANSAGAYIPAPPISNIAYVTPECDPGFYQIGETARCTNGVTVRDANVVNRGRCDAGTTFDTVQAVCTADGAYELPRDYRCPNNTKFDVKRGGCAAVDDELGLTPLVTPERTGAVVLSSGTITGPIAVQDPSLSAAGIQTRANNVLKNDAILQNACDAAGVQDCSLFKAICGVESECNKPDAVSRMGANGLMQVMPTTACSVDLLLPGCGSCNKSSTATCDQVANALRDQQTNVTVAAKYYAGLEKQFGNTTYAIAAYNGGAGANTPSKTCSGVTYWECNQNAGYRETRDYVTNVLAVQKKITGR